jgi:hypothetical protein
MQAPAWQWNTGGAWFDGSTRALAKKGNRLRFGATRFSIAIARLALDYGHAGVFVKQVMRAKRCGRMRALRPGGLH